MLQISNIHCLTFAVLLFLRPNIRHEMVHFKKYILGINDGHLFDPLFRLFRMLSIVRNILFSRLFFHGLFYIPDKYKYQIQ
jgi:hypothetical protein